MTRPTPILETIPDAITVHVPFRVVKRGGRKEMHLPEGAAQLRGAAIERLHGDVGRGGADVDAELRLRELRREEDDCAEDGVAEAAGDGVHMRSFPISTR